jgi:hypothetical protein
MRPLHGHFNLIHHATALRAEVHLSGADSLLECCREPRRSVDEA